MLDTSQMVLLISGFWWVAYFTRLLHVVRRGNFRRMPRLYLWLSVYGTGIIYYLHNYTLEQRLQEHVDFTGLPLVGLTKVLISSGVVAYGYVLVARRYTTLRIPTVVDYLVLPMLVVCIVYMILAYENVPYTSLQIISNIFVSCINLTIAIALRPSMRSILRHERGHVRRVHHIWFVIFMICSALAALLYLIDGVDKLLQNAPVIDSPLYVAAEISRSIYMIALAILIGHDRYLFWIYYPVHIVTFIRLKQLAEQLQRETQAMTVYTMPVLGFQTLLKLDLAIYRLFITVMDLYMYLDSNSTLYKRIRAIDEADASYDTTIRLLTRLR